MLEEKKKVITTEETQKNEEKEISLDELNDVAGGAIKNVRYTPTTEISKDTQNKI